jgi:hypothetical protein
VHASVKRGAQRRSAPRSPGRGAPRAETFWRADPYSCSWCVCGASIIRINLKKKNGTKGNEERVQKQFSSRAKGEYRG